ncbi:MAG: hypothetical protein MUF84_16415 [Anaerolineae bacterium]|nr:hypothetical protein [Anaerolineae bacterium]
MPQDRPGPRYRGVYKHIDHEGGYSIWIPSDWRKLEMTDGHKGAIYTPYPDRYDTCISTEKVVLEHKVTQKDVPILRKGFSAGLNSLPDVEVESQDETVTPTLIMFEAKVKFSEGEARRKRWIRVIYWGEGQLIATAQGATTEEFDYWMPMFYNSLMTVEIPVPG